MSQNAPDIYRRIRLLSLAAQERAMARGSYISAFSGIPVFGTFVIVPNECLGEVDTLVREATRQAHAPQRPE